MNNPEQQGRSEALRDVYVRSYDRLLRYGCSLVQDAELVHDAIQDLFLWLLKHPEVFANIKKSELYLIKCMRRNVLAAAQSQHKKREAGRSYTIEQPDAIDSIEADIMQQEEKEETIQSLKENLAKLSAHQREVLYLRYYERLSYDEIAEIQAVSNQVVRNAVSRAMKNLRRHFFDHLQHLTPLLLFLS